METKLFKYGIEDEDSDIRAHVSDKVIFVFKTSAVRSLLSRKKYPEKAAYQPGVKEPTAKGYLVCSEDIPDIRKLRFHERFNVYRDSMTTSAKGEFAVNMVVAALKFGRFPLWVEASQTTDKTIDINGTDILICNNQRIQVKCDYPAVRTGNLYIQTHEANPLRRY